MKLKNLKAQIDQLELTWIEPKREAIKLGIPVPIVREFSNGIRIARKRKNHFVVFLTNGAENDPTLHFLKGISVTLK